MVQSLRKQLGSSARSYRITTWSNNSTENRHVVFLELRRDSRVTTGNSGCLLCWPRQVPSSIRVAKESWFCPCLSHLRTSFSKFQLKSHTLQSVYLESPQVGVKLLQILYSSAHRLSADQGAGWMGWWPQIPCIMVQTENITPAPYPEADGLQWSTCH